MVSYPIPAFDCPQEDIGVPSRPLVHHLHETGAKVNIHRAPRPRNQLFLLQKESGNVWKHHFRYHAALPERRFVAAMLRVASGGAGTETAILDRTVKP